jgi:CubicO group peptidase (beta-lactamase class C family)
MSAIAWTAADAAAAGLRPDAAARLDAAVAAGELPGLHAVVVARHGRLGLERYYSGQDWSWARNLGVVQFGPETLHDLRSVSKSIVGLLYGIALAAGKVPPPETKLLDVFDYPDLAAEPARRALTIGHALTMTLGLEWNESVPYTDPTNAEIAMERSADRFRFVLGQAIEVPPGTRWTYCGGATALLGDIVSRGTGQDLLDYARTALLAPLGIDAAEWLRGSNGQPAAASGLRLRPRDLARIGQAALDGGAGVIPADWLAASFTPRARIDAEVDYGYQWYRYNGSAGGARWIGGIGNGGQRLILVPERGLVVAILCGNYDRPEQRTVPLRVLLGFVYAALAG